MNELLELYDKFASKIVKDMQGKYQLMIELNEDFMQVCRSRIIEGHKKYGDDWKWKNNIKEIEYEKYDIVNYLILNACQSEYLEKKAKKEVVHD